MRPVGVVEELGGTNALNKADGSVEALVRVGERGKGEAVRRCHITSLKGGGAYFRVSKTLPASLNTTFICIHERYFSVT